MKAILAYISGDGFGIPSVLDNPKILRKFQRTFSSLAFILPDREFWKHDEVRREEERDLKRVVFRKNFFSFC